MHKYKKGRLASAFSFRSNDRLLGRVLGLSALDVALLDPRHERTETLAGLFDRVVLALLEQLVVILQAALVFLDPLGGELTRLDFLEDLAHRLAG